MIPGLGRDPTEFLWIRISKKKPRTGTSSNASSPCEFFTWKNAFGTCEGNGEQMGKWWTSGKMLGKWKTKTGNTWQRKLLRSKTGKNSHDLHDNMVMFSSLSCKSSCRWFNWWAWMNFNSSPSLPLRIQILNVSTYLKPPEYHQIIMTYMYIYIYPLY